MNTFSQKYVVVGLPGIPVEDLRLGRAKTAGKARQTDHIDGPSRFAWCETEVGLCGEWVNGHASGGSRRHHAIKPEAERVRQSGTENMVLFQSNNLATRLEGDDLVIELIVLRSRGIVEHVAPTQAVRFREVVINAGNKIVLAGNSRTAKDVFRHVTRARNARVAGWTSALDGAIGLGVETQIGCGQWIHAGIGCTRAIEGRSGKIAKDAIPGIQRRYLIHLTQPEILPKTLVIAEDEGLVLAYRSASRYSKLVAPEFWLSAQSGCGGEGEGIPRIEGTVAQKLIGASMQLVRAGTDNCANDSARCAPVFSRVVCRPNVKFRNRIHAQISAYDTSGRLIRIVIDAYPVHQIVVLLRPPAGDTEFDAKSPA